MSPHALLLNVSYGTLIGSHMDYTIDDTADHPEWSLRSVSVTGNSSRPIS